VATRELFQDKFSICQLKSVELESTFILYICSGPTSGKTISSKSPVLLINNSQINGFLKEFSVNHQTCTDCKDH